VDANSSWLRVVLSEGSLDGRSFHRQWASEPTTTQPSHKNIFAKPNKPTPRHSVS